VSIADTDTLAAPAPRDDSLFRRNLQAFAGNRLALGSVIFVLLFVLMAIFAPLIAPQFRRQ
jgi:hypothetical protein